MHRQWLTNFCNNDCNHNYNNYVILFVMYYYIQLVIIIFNFDWTQVFQEYL